MTQITATAGFFLNDAVSPTTATDLITAVQSAQANVSSALTAETNAAASATAAASSALSASGSQTAAATSETNAAASATAAAGSVTSANTAASAAANSATSAATQATIATTQASNSLSSANAAASSATAAANSATNAATSATAAAASATTASNAAATIPSPTSHASQYLRVNGSGNAYELRAPLVVAADIGALNDVGRNKLHNPLFNIAQRGAGPFTSTGYTLDRWVVGITTDTASFSQVAMADADRSGVGDEEAAFALQNVFTGNAAAGAYNQVVHRVENVRRLSGKTVTVSFYAKANSGTPKLGVSIDQSFGTGGSPSSVVTGTGQSVTLSTSWARYQVQIAIPSISGKTLGTNNDHYTALNLWFSSGSTNATRAGSVGVQSNTVKIWGVQLESGFLMTPLEKPDPGRDLLLCQRFYTIGQAHLIGYANTSSIFVGTSLPFPTTMQMAPTVTIGSTIGTDSNVASTSADSPTVSGFRFVLTSTAAGMVAGSRNFTASADL